MRDISTKLAGDSYVPDVFNSMRDEIQNAVTSTDQTLDAEAGPDTDLFMLGQSLALYGSAAAYYQDSGSANSYVLSRSTNLKAVPAYKDGMVVIFKPDNMNTGASTINVSTLGVKNLTHSDGTSLAYADMIEDTYYVAVYRLGDDRFELVVSPSRTQILYQTISGIEDSDTEVFTFDFEPKYIVLQYNGGSRYISTLEVGSVTGTSNIEITTTDTITQTTNVARTYRSSFTVPDETIAGTAVQSISLYLYGGQNSVGSVASVIGTGTWVSSTHTLTITFQETNTDTSYSKFYVTATAYR